MVYNEPTISMDLRLNISFYFAVNLLHISVFSCFNFMKQLNFKLINDDPI